MKKSNPISDFEKPYKMDPPLNERTDELMVGCDTEWLGFLL